MTGLIAELITELVVNIRFSFPCERNRPAVGACRIGLRSRCRAISRHASNAAPAVVSTFVASLVKASLTGRRPVKLIGAFALHFFGFYDIP